MANLNGEQLQLITALTDTHKERIVGRAEIRARIEAEFEVQLQGIYLREAALAAEAYEKGVPKSRIGRAVGTTDWKTVEQLLADGVRMRPEAPRPAFEWTVGPSFGEYGDAWLVTAADYPNVMDLSELNLAAQFGWSGEVDGWVYRWDRGRWTVCGPAKVPEKVAEWVDRNPPAPVE